MDKISQSVQEVIEEYIRELGKQIPIQKVILFGSYAKGTTHKYSDVDIAIFSDYFKDMSRVDGIYFLLLTAMDYDIDIEPQPFTMDEYHEPVGLVEEILKTGIELKLPQASQNSSLYISLVIGTIDIIVILNFTMSVVPIYQGISSHFIFFDIQFHTKQL